MPVIEDGPIRQIDDKFAEFICEHQDIYPREMHEDLTTFQGLLKSGWSWGYFIDGQLVGWILFVPETPTMVYCYDVGVLREFQRVGIMKRLAKTAYRHLRWKGLAIRMHCRFASYPNPGFLFRCGYRIAVDRLIPNHYGKVYQSESLVEDAHELVLKPIGQ